MYKSTYSLFLLFLLASFHQISLSAVYKCELSGGKVEYQATPCMSGRDISTKSKQSSTTNTANAVGMKKADWLLRFKPIEIQGQCTNSPLKRKFSGSYQECSVAVEKLFNKCANSVENVKIPDMLTNIQEAEKYGSIMGECITAYYFGGEYLSIFNTAQSGNTTNSNQLFGKWKSTPSKELILMEFTDSTMTTTPLDFSSKPTATSKKFNINYTKFGKNAWNITIKDYENKPISQIFAVLVNEKNLDLNIPTVGKLSLVRQ
jgi:hypothetical protein